MSTRTRPGLKKDPVQDRSRFLVESILEAAAEVLEEVGAAFSIQQVIARAGVSPGSFYQYFGDRNDLIAQLLDRQLSKDQALLKQAKQLPSPQDFDEAVGQLVDGLLRLYQPRPRTMLALFELHQLLGRDAELKALMQECVNVCTARLLGKELDAPTAGAVVHGILAMIRHVAAEAPQQLHASSFRAQLISVARAARSNA